MSFCLKNHFYRHVVYTKIYKKELQELESSQDHVIKKLIALRSVSADSNVALESAFFR